MKNLLTFISVFVGFNAVAQNAVFTDHGFIPVPTVAAGMDAGSEFQSAIYYSNHVFIATSDGVWKNNLTTQGWSVSGLQGKLVMSIYQHPTIPTTFFAGVDDSSWIYISTNGGSTWNPVSNPVQEHYYCIAVRPGYPNHVYASVEGLNIAVSTDGGQQWEFMNYNGGGYFGYSGNITFLPGVSSKIYLGGEGPLDCAWLASYDIDATDPVVLTNYSIVVDGQGGSGPWENRRPNKLQTYSYTGNKIYVGHEGALSKVNSSGVNQTQFVYFSSGQPNVPYSYIYGIWVDPADTMHLIFGGSLNNSIQPMQLYETYNSGATFHQYTQQFGLVNPQVCDVVDVGPNKVAVVLNDQMAGKVKLIVMQPGPQSVNENEWSDLIEIYPNPAHSVINLSYGNLHVNEMNISLVNSVGQVVLKENKSSAIRSLPVEGISAGVYYLEMEVNGEKLSSQKIIIE